MPSTRPITAAELFDLFSDWHRCIEQIDPLTMCSTRPLTRDMTIAAWGADAGPCIPRVFSSFSWRRVGHWFEATLGVQLPPSEWKHLLRESRSRTLFDLCRELALHVRVPRLAELEILGSRCLAAAVFRHVQAAAKKNDLSRFTPSTPLVDLDRDILGVLTFEAGKLAPGVMPLEETRTERENLMTSFFLQTCLAAGLASFISLVFLPAFTDFFTAVSIASGFFGCARAAYIAYARHAGEVIRSFGEFHTVADVCRAIAARHRMLT